MHGGRWETAVHHLIAEKIAPGMPGRACLAMLHCEVGVKCYAFPPNKASFAQHFPAAGKSMRMIREKYMQRLFLY